MADIRDGFYRRLINCIYKILPLKEEGNDGLDDYVDSVLIQLYGSLNTYPDLNYNQQFISIINTLQYFRNNEYTVKQCKRETFRCINILQNMIEGR